MSNIIDALMNGGVRKRSVGGLEDIAKALKCELATVQAVVDVESGGSGVDSSGHVKVLFEKHKFYKHLPAAKRAAAVKAGLARKEWISPANGGYKDQPNNSAALDFLVRAVAIDETAALKSASYGAGQVLGENFGLCGWPSVQAFVLDMCESEDKHIEAMMGFLTGNGLADELRDKDFDAVARVYNGSGQVKVYGAKLRAAYKKHAGKSPEIKSAVRQSGLRVGSTGYRVEALQKRLNEVGFPLKVDKDFGTTTRNAVMAFQAAHGLDVDGVVGPETQAALDVAESTIPESRANATVSDLRAEGSTTIKNADKTQAISIVTGVAATVGAADKAGVFDKIKQASDAAAALTEPLSILTKLVTENWWLLAGGVGVALFLIGKKIKETRLAGHQAGRIV